MTVVLGILFAGYLVLGGLDYGVAMIGRGYERIAPFFLGNQVWLVAAIGIFTVTKADLPMPASAVAILGAATVMATFGMRLFGQSSLDWVARIGGVLAAAGWGFVLWSWPGALILPVLLAVHGWAFASRWWIVLPLTTAAIVAGVFWTGSQIAFHPSDAATVNIIQPIAYAVIPLVAILQLISWLLFTRAKPAQPV